MPLALGYVAWNLALPSLSRTVAATVRSSVPPVAALGALALLGEAIGVRFAVASALVLGGIAAVVLTRRRPAPPPTRGTLGPCRSPAPSSP